MCLDMDIGGLAVTEVIGARIRGRGDMLMFKLLLLRSVDLWIWGRLGRERGGERKRC